MDFLWMNRKDDVASALSPQVTMAAVLDASNAADAIACAAPPACPTPPPPASPSDAVMTTPRLVMRYLRADDVAHLMPILGDLDVTRYLSYHAWKSEEDGRAWCEEFAETNRVGSTAWFVCLEKSTGCMVGDCVLFDHDHACRRAELGYMFGRQWWRRGYAQEAVTALIDHGFRRCGLQRLEAQIHVANIASQQLALKLGFQCEGLLRNRLVNCHGVPHDVFMYSLLRQDTGI